MSDSSETSLASLMASDPRVVQARELIVAAIRDHQNQLNEIRPPRPERNEEYDRLLSRFGDLRGGELYYRYLGSGLGRGPLVELLDGSVKYDMISGIGVHICGHSHPELIDTLVTAALSDTVMQGNLQQNFESMLLCDEIVSIARESGAPLDHCFLSTSGATANENALKILFQAKFPADRMLTFANGFSGRTMALAQLTDRPKNREGLPTTIEVDYIPFFDGSDPSGSTQRSVEALRIAVARYPGRHAGICLELIQGEGGYYAAPREFFVALFDVLRAHEIPIWIDEVQTFGRTTRLFAYQHLGLDQFAEVVTIGKMSQVCATLFSDRLKPKPGLVSQTFTGATSSIHAARWILGRFRAGDSLGEQGRTMRIHERFVAHFERIASSHPEWIQGPWGVGGMVAFSVFDGSGERTKAFLNRLFEAGVIAFPAGSQPTRVRMLPPLLAIEDEDIDTVCGVIAQVLGELAEA